jgi:hypothetical protein
LSAARKTRPAFRRRGAIALAAASLLAAGCQSWHPRSGPVPETIAAQHSGGAVRITRRDNGVFEMRNPVIAGDSIVGLVGDPPRRHAIATADVARVESRRVSGVRTAGLAVGTAVAVLAVATAAAVVLVLAAWD